MSKHDHNDCIYIYTLRSACSLVKIHRECKARYTVYDICSSTS